MFQTLVFSCTCKQNGYLFVPNYLSFFLCLDDIALMLALIYSSPEKGGVCFLPLFVSLSLSLLLFIPFFFDFPFSIFHGYTFQYAASTVSSLFKKLISNCRSFGLDIRKNLIVYSLQHAKLKKVEGSLNNGLLVGSLSRYYTSLREFSSLAKSVKTHFSCIEGVEFNRVDYIVSVLHESARSFSKAVESLGVSRCGPELTMAWIGKDVHEWHRRIAYQVAVYVLMKTAIDLEILLSHERHNEFSPVREILNPLTNQVGEHIELQLGMQHPDLVHWFRDTEMPQIAAYFIPLLKQWSVEYAGSGIAGIIVAITCCTAVVKLGCGRIRCPIPVLCFEDVLVKLMDFSLNLASVDKLHQLATEAGFELNFLLHFGKKILPSEKTEELEFWIGLAHKKLQKAFSEESIMSNKKSEHKIPSDTLAILGLFAYLGRRTRIFLSAMGIKDLDEIVKDLLRLISLLVHFILVVLIFKISILIIHCLFPLSYLECGILFIYPDFSCIPVYQCFMEVVTDEIGWLDFYASYVQINCKQKRQKHNARQAEKEIILSVVFTVCYDVFSGFAHFNRSTQQSLDTASLSYLLHCQGLLSNCLQDHWAAYDKSGDSLNIMDHAASDNHTSSYIGGINGTKLTLVFEGQHRSHDLTTKGFPKIDSHNSSGFPKAPISATNKESSFGQVSVNDKSSPLHQSVIKRYSTKLALTSADLWMGTRLLFMDIKVALQLLAMQAHGFKASRSQRKRLERTLTDVIVLIPMTILMLLPVTTVGHAAIIAAIKKYMPFLIPSSYSPERLDVVKQLKQTREMMSKSNQSLQNQEDQPPTIS
ncbi:uncharacterized protein LOC107616797 isoform X2 [Arachis ipaensis]|uniref:uncharacterized protein LOC107616797 isoform X2 n=1 Tax=Arachis ipaensis TaxID=130454 RepID=UPI000A2B1E03|nr:uncharacterized protein LOC107616797 isoform X2 [Arachis ipaensis]